MRFLSGRGRMLTNATIVRSKALECAYDAQKTHITQTCPDTLHGRVGMHTRCTNSAQVMHVKCALNARRPGSLRPLLLVLLLVLIPPRRGVCSIAAILEDPEEVVDVVLLLVGGQPTSYGRSPGGRRSSPPSSLAMSRLASARCRTVAKGGRQGSRRRRSSWRRSRRCARASTR